MAKTRRAKLSNLNWLTELRTLVSKKPLVIIRFTEDEWESLRNSQRGTHEFTVARSYLSLENVHAPTACILIGQTCENKTEAHFGLLKSCRSVTTLESRLKIVAAQLISPSSEKALLDLVSDNALKPIFRKRIELDASVIPLSPTLSAHLVEKLAKGTVNRRAMHAVTASLNVPTTYSGNNALQEDALALALKTFGMSGGEAASFVDIVDDRETSLARINILEDAVIEHDARVVPEFKLSHSDLTGRAKFTKGDEVLEVITANKRPLEEVLGVDLIYLNAVKKNIVMVQYKMLEPDRKKGGTDWLYRPDGQLDKEMERMKRFGQSHAPGPLEYRINPEVFYLRFVRRDANLGKSAVTMPIGHFRVLRRNPDCKGPRGAFRISYESLDGRYLRQNGFLDLIRSGYIGAYAQTTTDLNSIIEDILKNGRAVVAAYQSSLP